MGNGGVDAPPRRAATPKLIRNTAFGPAPRRPSSSCYFESRMFQRRLSLLAQMLVVTLLVTSQCYAMCAVSPCSSATHRNSQCDHQSEHGHRSGNSCQHSHSDLFSPQSRTDLVKVASFHVTGAMPLLSTGLSAVVGQPAGQVLRSERHGPDATNALALLSIFRI